MGEAALDVPDDASADYRQLFAAHHARILAYCARRVGRQEASDVASEVFAVAWRRREACPNGDRALPWLYGIAYRVVSHHWRGSGRRRRLRSKLAGQAASRVEGPEVQLVQQAEFDRVLAAAARLPPKDREVLRLAVWEELSHGEIGRVLGCSEPAARQRFHRAKRALLKAYVDLGGVVPIPAVAPEGGDT